MGRLCAARLQCVTSTPRLARLVVAYPRIATYKGRGGTGFQAVLAGPVQGEPVSHWAAFSVAGVEADVTQYRHPRQLCHVLDHSTKVRVLEA